MAEVISFTNLVNSIYALSFDERVEIQNLLSHNIANSRRDAILENYKQSKIELASGKLMFSSNINQLKRML